MWSTWPPHTPRRWSTWSATSISEAPTLPPLTQKGPATNLAQKLIITTPPFAWVRLTTESGTSRGWAQSALDEECENMTGALVQSSTAFMVASCTCEMSTTMPSRFISFTTSRPKGESPPTLGSTSQVPSASSAGSAQTGPPLWVRVKYRTPKRWYMRSTASELLIWWPPSAPIRHAILPSPKMRRAAAAEGANSKVSGYFSHMRWTTSICSRVF
mmetsp:Transcript_56014/g.127272  ORF Transcript_56014/g.127272 Transcript_56014/m.127272 type:complete len:215 (-) Transcript_56014:430-1074(-)